MLLTKRVEFHSISSFIISLFLENPCLKVLFGKGCSACPEMTAVCIVRKRKYLDERYIHIDRCGISHAEI